MGSSAGDGSGASSEDFFGIRRKSRSRIVQWVLVDGDRLVVAACGAVLVCGLLLGLHAADAIAFANANSVTRMASGMIAGTFSLVTLVVSVNQLILSQEFSPAGEFRDRFGGVQTFRRDVADATGVPATPAEPTRMLELLVAAIRDSADELADAVDDHENEEYRELVGRYADNVTDEADRVADRLDRADVSAYDVLSAAVEYEESVQLYGARHLHNDADELSERESAAFDDLIEAFELFGTAQAHFKTIYLQRELTRFSQLTIYVGVPSILAASLIPLVYGDLGGMAIDVTFLPYVTALLATIVLAPVCLLAAYILRTATLTRRTAEIGPMVPQKDPDEGPFEVSYGRERNVDD
ncbi:hypothetical protein ACFQDG_12125 [Natronoarchaeum mannanilyticum]|uniref:Flagellar protein FlaJ n=1 Tax=Natronoarchaeum mannanilyticum TaxID=926360 RepID=A0AAV3T6Z1_9EURY